MYRVNAIDDETKQNSSVTEGFFSFYFGLFIYYMEKK